MVRAVLDTKVVISAHLNFEGPHRSIFDLVFSRFFRCFVSEELLAELAKYSTEQIWLNRRGRPVAWRFSRGRILVEPRDQILRHERSRRQQSCGMRSASASGLHCYRQYPALPQTVPRHPHSSSPAIPDNPCLGTKLIAEHRLHSGETCQSKLNFRLLFDRWAGRTLV